MQKSPDPLSRWFEEAKWVPSMFQGTSTLFPSIQLQKEKVGWSDSFSNPPIENYGWAGFSFAIHVDFAAVPGLSDTPAPS